MENQQKTCDQSTPMSAVSLYYQMQRNPQRQDEFSIVAACFVRKGVMPPGYTGADLARLGTPAVLAAPTALSDLAVDTLTWDDPRPANLTLTMGAAHPLLALVLAGLGVGSLSHGSVQGRHRSGSRCRCTTWRLLTLATWPRQRWTRSASARPMPTGRPSIAMALRGLDRVARGRRHWDRGCHCGPEALAAQSGWRPGVGRHHRPRRGRVDPLGSRDCADVRRLRRHPPRAGPPTGIAVATVGGGSSDCLACRSGRGSAGLHGGWTRFGPRHGWRRCRRSRLAGRTPEQHQQGTTTTVNGSIRLATALSVLPVPPSALGSVSAQGTSCVTTPDGPRSVTVVGSRLGTAFVQPGPGSAIRTIILDPARARPCT
jgi:hypothetical protein